MMPSAPLNSEMVIMLEGNDFDLNQQVRPGYYENATNPFQGKKNSFHTGLKSFREKAFTKCGIYIKATLQSRLLSHRQTSWWSHNLQCFLATQSGAMPTRYTMAMPVLPRSAYEMSLAGKSKINSQRANHSNLPHVIHWVRLTKVPIKEGGMHLLFQMYSNVFFPFSLSIFVSSIKRDKLIFYKGTFIKPSHCKMSLTCNKK